jgi:hypothetical protein
MGRGSRNGCMKSINHRNETVAGVVGCEVGRGWISWHQAGARCRAGVVGSLDGRAARPAWRGHARARSPRCRGAWPSRRDRGTQGAGPAPWLLLASAREREQGKRENKGEEGENTGAAAALGRSQEEGVRV